MADQQKGAFERERVPGGGGLEGAPHSIEQREGGLTPEKAAERPSRDNAELAEDKRRKLESGGAGQERPVERTGKSDPELAKEKRVQQIIQRALAAGEDSDQVQKIFEDAARDLKDLRLIDEIHDRYTEARNLESGGMYT
jgi:hypothetical protein